MCLWGGKVQPIMHIVFVDSATLPGGTAELKRLPNYREYGSTSARDLVARCASADIVITGRVALSMAHIRKLPRLKMIAVPGPALDHVDLDCCREAGIAVRNCDGYAETGVAEHVVALMMWLSRGIALPRGRAVQDLNGKVLGIVGTGMMGKATSRLARAIGMRVIHAERKNSVGVRDGYLQFHSVLTACDILSLHCPLTPDTAHMLGRPEFAAMRPGALLINTADPGLVHEAALAEALASGRLGGAGLDYEPALPELPNLIATPQLARLSDTSQDRMRSMLMEHITSFLRANGTAENAHELTTSPKRRPHETHKSH